MPKVSVILPTYNREKYIRDAIDSVLRQTFTDFKLVVVDDGSTDNTRAIVNEYTDPRVEYIYQENSGVSVARNTGIKSSDSEYIAFLDSDDMYLAHMLEKSIRTLDEHPEAGFSYGQSEIMRDGAGTYRVRKSPFHRSSTVVGQLEQVKELLSHCPITTPTFVTRRKIMDEVGGFHPDLWTCQDYHYFVKAAKRYAGYYIAEPLVIIRFHEKQLHKQNRKGREKAFNFILSEVFDDPEFAPRVEDIKGKAFSYFYRTWIFSSAYDYYHNMKLARQHLRKAIKYYPKVIFTRDIFHIAYKYVASLIPQSTRDILRKTKRLVYFPLRNRE